MSVEGLDYYPHEEFTGALGKDNVFATEFHPVKSGGAGLRVIEAFLSGDKEDHAHSLWIHSAHYCLPRCAQQ